MLGLGRLPFEFPLHDPALGGPPVALLQHGERLVAGCRLVQTAGRVDMLERLLLFVVDPELIAAHAVTAKQLDRTSWRRGVQAVVV